MICLDAFKNINIMNKQGDLHISPCCISPTQKRDVVDFVNDPYLKEIRDTWIAGSWPTACSACRIEEEHGFTSRRQGANQWYQDNNHNNTNEKLVRIDYYTGNLCNLACAICGPHNSSAWSSEMGIRNVSYVQNEFWRTMDCSELSLIHFNGGEPLLSKEHVLFLESLQNKSSVTLNYNTNATILPSVRLQELWSKFKFVILDFSIDDIEDKFEYQRYPAKWQSVVENLNWFRDNSDVNTMFGINTTVGVLNMHSIVNLENWISDNFASNRMGDATVINKQLATGILETNNLTKDPKMVVSYLNSLDKRRGTDWRTTFPELAKLL